MLRRHHTGRRSEATVGARGLSPVLPWLLTLAAVLASAGAARGQCAACLRAAGAGFEECTSSATGAFQDTLDSCLARDHECVQACRWQRQSCRDSTGFGAELVACGMQRVVDTARCRERFALVPRKARMRRASCIDRAQSKELHCRRESRRRLRRALAGCDRAFHHCASACGPGQPPGGTHVCRAQGTGAFHAVVADCTLTFHVTANSCLNKDGICVQECSDARGTCTAPTQATLGTALAACTTQEAAAVTACHAANPAGGAPFQQCVTGAQAAAADCRDVALAAAAPGVATCVPPYVTCVHGCPSPSSSEP